MPRCLNKLEKLGGAPCHSQAGAALTVLKAEQSAQLFWARHAGLQVWDSMEDAGRLVLLSARDSTASVVRQRCGGGASNKAWCLCVWEGA